MFGRLDSDDRRAAIAGVVVLALLAVLYPVMADAAARPLAVFVLPSLLTAVLGGWRPTLLIGVASLVVAVLLGVLGPLDAERADRTLVDHRARGGDGRGGGGGA